MVEIFSQTRNKKKEFCLCGSTANNQSSLNIGRLNIGMSTMNIFIFLGGGQ